VGQDKQEWSEDYEIQFEDFKNGGTEINEELSSYSLSAGTHLAFAMQKNAYSFALSKNFNSNVSAILNRSSAILVAPDSATAHQLLQFARFSFDLTELYARKFRKRMYEEKETFSKSNFYEPIFDDINEELANEHSRVLKLTDLGREEALLKKEHDLVKIKIVELADFCKACRPPKKVKNKSK